MLQLGVSRKDITPQVGGHLFGYSPNRCSTFLHDPLDVTALVFGFGEEKIALISATVCLLNSKLVETIHTKIQEKTGICRDNIIITATHTHSAPNLADLNGVGDIDWPYYETVFLPQLLAAVEEAMASMVPVQVGIAAGESQIGINRRQRKEDKVILGQNPWGPYDPTMTVISFRNEEKVVANIIHYGCHGTCAGTNTAITRDWSGIMVDTLQTVTGGTTVFINGPEGDVGPRISNGKTTGNDGMKYVVELGQKAAEDAIRVYRSIDSYTDADMEICKSAIRIPLRPRVSPEEAEAGLAASADPACGRSAKWARYYQKVLNSYEEGYAEQPDLPLGQWLLRIGDTVIVTTGCELFSEIGLRIKTMSNYRVLCAAVSNGYDGYFTTDSELCMGGYEVVSFLTDRVQALAEHADWHFVKETLRNIEEKLNKKAASV